MTSFDAFLGKMSSEVQSDLSDLHGTVWDEDQSISNCRRCNIEFTLLIRKHHCRECGGIYCDGCAPPSSISLVEIQEKSSQDSGKWYPGKYLGRKQTGNSNDNNNSNHNNNNNSNNDDKVEDLQDDGKWYPGKYLGRKNPTKTEQDTPRSESEYENQLICIGCRYGETPGIQTRGLLKNLYKEYRTNNPEATILPPAKSFTLLYGSLYGEGEKSERCLRRVDGQPAHSSGYFEILNKSEYITAIRVSEGGSESLREHCRPSYFTLMPQQCLYTIFPSNIPLLEVSVLYNNTHRLYPNVPLNSLVYNTRSAGMTKELISPQCAVQNFTEISIYSIRSQDKNIILKYQGSGVIELRKLTTTKLNKKGAFGMLTSMLSSSSTSSTPPSSPTSSAASAPSSSSLSTTTSTSTVAQTSPTTTTNNDSTISILDFTTNATEISRDLTSSLIK